MKRPIIGLVIGAVVLLVLQNPDWTKAMLIDQIIGLADELGVPTEGDCSPTRSRACMILERIEILFVIDYAWNAHPPLGERFRIVTQRVPA